MKKILLITSQFPYGTGEQFLETEVKYYNKDTQLTVVPLVKSKNYRDIPNNVMVDDYLAENSFTKSKLLYLFNSLFAKVFYKELSSNSLFNLKKLKIFISSVYQYQMYYEIFDTYFQKQKNRENLIVYTYWHNEITYALQSLKDKYKYKLVSRIHRGDLYQERKPFYYMPLKRQFTENIDKIYTITQSANHYLEDIYGFKKNRLSLSRLGVEDRNIITSPSKEKVFTIVSCSYVVEVKRIDKIILALKQLANRRDEVLFRWVHLGDGELLEDIKKLANNELSSLKNLEFDFVGQLDNSLIYEFYQNNNIDVFVNVSESEGVPVSIMEAMSCHIPIIAPDIGGISDMLINWFNGKLLSPECMVEELVDALEDISFFKNQEIRENSYKLFLEKYDAKKNYVQFLERIAL